MITTREEYLAAVEKARLAAKIYYDTGENPGMSDLEYDTLVEDIEQASAAFGWTEGAELLHAVAAGQSTGGDVKHSVPMLSLNKVKTLADVESFVAKVPGAKVILENKLDGLAISAKYENGVLIRVATRGDGVTGEDITAKVKVSNFKGLPHRINETIPLEIRGEVYISDADFLLAQAGRKKAGAEPFANSRNAVAGSLRTSKDTSYVPFTFGSYDVIGLNEDSYLARMAHIRDLGFRPTVDLLPEEIAKLPKISDQITFIGRIRDTLDFPNDGIVLKFDSSRVRQQLGEGSRAPRWGVAYKFEASDAKRTVVREIQVTVGRTGRVAFRGKVDPVTVDGSTLQYVSLHNVAWIEKMDVRIGDTVVIAKANDIIPQILEVIKTERKGTELPWVAPAVCPNCGETFDKSTLLWRCTSMSCSVVARIAYAVSREAWDIEFFSNAIAEAVVEHGLVKNVADIFKLNKQNLATLPMGTTTSGNVRYLGETVAGKIAAEIEKARTSAPFSRTLIALGLRGTGRGMSRRIVAKFHNIENIINASAQDLATVEGIAADGKAELIRSEIRLALPVIKELMAVGLKMSEAPPAQPAGNGGGLPLAGKKVVVTGSMSGSKLDKLSRNDMNELIEKFGGTASSSVSSSTNILVCAEPTSSKAVKAKQLGTVKIVTPNEFAAMLGM